MFFVGRKQAFSTLLARSSKHLIRRRALTLAAALGATAAIAAQVDSGEMERLQQEANVHGAVRVLVALHDNAALDSLKDSLPRLRVASAQSTDVLLKELGSGALSTGRWKNGLGQIGLYVTAAGLRVLQASANARSFQADLTSKLRSRVHELDGSVEAIEALLSADGFADVEIALNVEASDYDIGKDGRTAFRPPAAAASAEIASHVTRLRTHPFANAMRNLEATAASPIVNARIDRPAFYAMRESDSVRAIRPVGFIDRRRLQLTAELLDSARKNGMVEAIVTLRGGLTYSSKSGFMTDKAWKLQAKAHQRVFNEILAGSGAKPIAASESSLALGSLHAKLPYSMLQRLAANPDPRILAIDINKPAAHAFLSNSMPLINMPSAWRAGYVAAGQFIIVVDSGIRKDHAMFQFGGASKVVYEACFGTNSSTYVSICPSADASGDSPPGLFGSGEPDSNAGACNAFPGACAHGTHVAGIAAGLGSSSVPLQGVAIGAMLVSAQVFSYDATGSAEPSAFNADIFLALSAVHAATTPGLNNPYTVNMSLGEGFFLRDCPAQDAGVTSAVQNLVSRGVPVVVATGNDGFINAISWPACVPQTIKVSSVLNDATGAFRSSFANIARPANFTGPILLAPGGGFGTYIYSAGITSPTATLKLQGTSQAAPHVAGIYAAIKAAIPGISVADATAWIVSSGSVSVRVNVPGSIQSFPRINIPHFN